MYDVWDHILTFVESLEDKKSIRLLDSAIEWRTRHRFIIPNEQQWEVLAMVENPEIHRILVTGPAGTGKSYLIRAISRKYPDTMITSTTGISAHAVDGSTIHSQFRHISDHDIVIVDEISMMGSRLYEKIMKHVRRRTNVKLIFFGDFLQLPPVMDVSLIDVLTTLSDFRHIDLTRIMRQKDKDFRSRLEKIRIGKYKKDDVDRFLTEDMYAEDSAILRLYCTRKRVKKWNLDKFHELDTPIVHFPVMTIRDDFYLDESDFRIQDIDLRIGCRVMLMFNLNVKRGLTNGARGYVIGFTVDDNVLVDFDNIGVVVVKTHIESKVRQYVDAQGEITWLINQREGIPLCLAWSMTVHKCQGMTINEPYVVDLSDSFHERLCYVALSRATRPEYIKLIGYKHKNPGKPIRDWNNFIKKK